MFVGCVWFHLSDRFNLALQDDKSFVVKVDTLAFEQRRDVGEIGFASVDVVFTGIVLKGFTGDDQI